MRSRYDYYDESSVLDEDGLSFPDPLAIDYNKGQVQSIPMAIKVSASQLAKPWTLSEEYFGAEDLDDILLLENNVPYIGYLKPGDDLYIPRGNDLTGFITTAISNSRVD